MIAQRTCFLLAAVTSDRFPIVRILCDQSKPLPELFASAITTLCFLLLPEPFGKWGDFFLSRRNQNRAKSTCNFTSTENGVNDRIEFRSTAQASGKVIELYPGQKLSKEDPGVIWDHNASAETIQKVKDKLADSKIKA